jgi:pyruvate/2-oxoglutarate dehydrogenase complex dihydrolipoamide acyltransferase (E2) component
MGVEVCSMPVKSAPTAPVPPASSGVPAARSAARPRGVERRAFPVERRVVLAAERAGRAMVPMHGLVELDVTDARRLLAEPAPPLSFTAFVLSCVARAAATHPEVHAYRDLRGRLVQHRHVDITTLIEVPAPSGPFPLAHVVRDADVRSVADLSSELRGVKADLHSSRSGELLVRFRHVALRAPGAVPLLTAAFRFMARSERTHRFTGTIAVTAVGMFGGGGGFGIASPTLMSLQVVVGGVSRKPRDVGGRVELRDVLDLTVTFDHNVVDGGPAARFAADLRREIESAAVLRS